jgi:hypothetical protein
MNEHWVQLVQRDSGPPTAQERPLFVVRREQPIQERQSEQGKHGEVGFSMAAVDRRVDQAGEAVGAPQHVSGPQVAVDERRRLDRAA